MSKLEIVVSCVILSFVFAATESTYADVPNAEESVKLSEQLRNIIERNQANWDSVKTMQGIVRIEMKTDYGDQGISHIIETEKFWFDGNRQRSDILNNEQVGREGPLEREDSGGRKAIVTGRDKGMIEIKTGQSTIWYIPRISNVNIFPSKEDATRLRRENKLLGYQSINGTALKKAVLDIAKNGLDCTVTNETIDKDECLLLEYNLSNERVWKIWVVPSKGHCIKKMQSMSKGLLYSEFITTLKEYPPGIWWLDSVKSRDSLGGRLNYEENVFVDSLTFNEPIDPNIFTLAGTNIPHGTRVHDRITGKSYYHVNLPVTPSLIGRPLPEFDNIKIESFSEGTREKMLLVCFIDMQQRPSRNCLLQLSQRVQEFKDKSIILVAVQASKVERAKLDELLQNNQIAFPVGLLEGDSEIISFDWGVRSLPWLILTDKQHIVRAEGFNINEINKKIESIDDKN